MSHSIYHEFSESPTDKELLLHLECGESSVSWESSNSAGPEGHENLRKPLYNSLGPSLIIHAALVTAYTILFIFLVLPQQKETSSIIYCTIPFPAIPR